MRWWTGATAPRPGSGRSPIGARVLLQAEDIPPRRGGGQGAEAFRESAIGLFTASLPQTTSMSERMEKKATSVCPAALCGL